jgi:acyl-CoA reductase-like NAD-dependent aldehyde dehydrogenase
MTIQVPGPTDATEAAPIHGHWIDGRQVEVLAEHTGPVFDPSTGKVIARVPRNARSLPGSSLATTARRSQTRSAKSCAASRRSNTPVGCPFTWPA